MKEKKKSKITMLAKTENFLSQLHLNTKLAMVCPQLLSIGFRLENSPCLM